MARVPIQQMRQRTLPTLDAQIQDSLNLGHIDGHYGEVIYPAHENEQWIKTIRAALFAAARRLGVSLKAEVEPVEGGFQVRFHAIDKQVARAYIAAKSKGDPANLAYNPYRRTS